MLWKHVIKIPSQQQIEDRFYMNPIFNPSITVDEPWSIKQIIMISCVNRQDDDNDDDNYQNPSEIISEKDNTEQMM